MEQCNLWADALHNTEALDGKVRDQNPEATDVKLGDRLKQRRLIIKPLVEAYFAWIKEQEGKTDPKSKPGKTIRYSINQEKYLKVFSEDAEVPMDNNAAERAIRPFTVGRKNWVMIDTVSGAEAGAIVYSLVETAKANGLNVYQYFKPLLTEIPKHMEDTDLSFCEDLLPWSEKLPPEYRKDRYNKKVKE